jgi:hypothetical protein
METELQELRREINTIISEMQIDMEKGVTSSNLAAHRRARVASLKLEKLMKKYRAISPKGAK